MESSWAVITGAGQGLGAALVIELSGKGYQVLAVDIDLSNLQTALSDHPMKGSVHTIQGDVTEEEIINKISSYIPGEHQIKFFIPCQRVGYLAQLQELKMADFENAFKVHVVSPLYLSQKLIPRLKQSTGRILLTITPVEAFPQLGWACYGITKTAFHKLGQQLKMELNDGSVCVGTVNPGLVNTEGFQQELKNMKDASFSSEATFKNIDKAKEHGAFHESASVARFLRYLLLDTSDADFVATDWCTDDRSHWQKWNN